MSAANEEAAAPTAAKAQHSSYAEDITSDAVARAVGLFEEADRRGFELPRVPDRFDTFAQALRFEHADLRSLSGESLAREQVLARWVWSLPGSPGWWAERARAVEVEIARRRGEAR